MSCMSCHNASVWLLLRLLVHQKQSEKRGLVFNDSDKGSVEHFIQFFRFSSAILKWLPSSSFTSTIDRYFEDTDKKCLGHHQFLFLPMAIFVINPFIHSNSLWTVTDWTPKKSYSSPSRRFLLMIHDRIHKDTWIFPRKIKKRVKTVPSSDSRVFSVQKYLAYYFKIFMQIRGDLRQFSSTFDHEFLGFLGRKYCVD